MSTICFTLGLSSREIKAGEDAFYAVDQRQSKLATVPITQNLLTKTVSEVIDTKQAVAPQVSSPGSVGQATDDKPDETKYRMVLINSQIKEQVVQIMRSFKQVLPDPGDVIFAMVTDTAQTWTFDKYIKHLTEEHEYMKNRSPADNPDMKPME